MPDMYINDNLDSIVRNLGPNCD